ARAEEGAAGAEERAAGGEEEAPGAEEAAAEVEGSDTSATWAAPQKPAELESATHPNVAGTIDSEPIEAEIDSIIDPAPEPEPKEREDQSPAGTDEPNETEEAG